jgi:CheY-like chemotaxis protein
MYRFLVVDDSPLAQQIAADVLKRAFDATVVCASDGLEAVRCLEQDGPFHLILSDLEMPSLDGLSLLAIVLERFPSTPLIVFTAFGNEEIAVKAIQQGAASYLPKKQIVHRLPGVAKTVLNASTRRTLRDRLAQHVVSHELEFNLSNDRELIAAVVAELQEVGQAVGTCDNQQLTRIGVALEESLVNAMIHGNLEVSSDLREREDDAYEQLIRARQQDPAYRDRRIRVRGCFTPMEIRFVIRDQGPGFDVTTVPDPTKSGNFSKVSGRGLLLIRSFMDEVFHDETGNTITMIKRGSRQVSDE